MQVGQRSFVGAARRGGLGPNSAEKRNVLPRPGSLSTVICPPISATNRAAIDSPSPVSEMFGGTDPSGDAKLEKFPKGTRV